MAHEDATIRAWKDPDLRLASPGLTHPAGEIELATAGGLAGPAYDLAVQPPTHWVKGFDINLCQYIE